MSTLEIRPTTAADLPFITWIYEHAVRYGTATFELIPPDLAEMTRRFDALMDGGFPYFAAVLEGRVVGCARLPADDRRHRRFRQCRLGWRAYEVRIPDDRDPPQCRLQIRPLARHR